MNCIKICYSYLFYLILKNWVFPNEGGIIRNITSFCFIFANIPKMHIWECPNSGLSACGRKMKKNEKTFSPLDWKGPEKLLKTPNCCFLAGRSAMGQGLTSPSRRSNLLKIIGGFPPLLLYAKLKYYATLFAMPQCLDICLGTSMI